MTSISVALSTVGYEVSVSKSGATQNGSFVTDLNICFLNWMKIGGYPPILENLQLILNHHIFIWLVVGNIF